MNMTICDTATLQDAMRYRKLKQLAKETYIRAPSASDEFLIDTRTYWKLPMMICSGPVGGYIDFDEAVDNL